MARDKQQVIIQQGQALTRLKSQLESMAKENQRLKATCGMLRRSLESERLIRIEQEK